MARYPRRDGQRDDPLCQRTILLREEGRPVDTAGSGDDVGGLALLCGILGFFPGFGIGHLVAGNISGFILFLVVDPGHRCGLLRRLSQSSALVPVLVRGEPGRDLD